jgi:ribosomal protein S25
LLFFLQHECKESASAAKKSKKRKRDKDSDAEDEKENASNIPLLEKEKIDNIKEHDAEVEPETLLRQRAASSPSKKNDEKVEPTTSVAPVFTKATLNDSNEADRKE